MMVMVMRATFVQQVFSWDRFGLVSDPCIAGALGGAFCSVQPLRGLNT